MTSIDNSLVYGEDSTDGKEGIKKTSKTSNGAVSWCKSASLAAPLRLVWLWLSLPALSSAAQNLLDT